MEARTLGNREARYGLGGGTVEEGAEAFYAERGKINHAHSPCCPMMMLLIDNLECNGP